MKIIKIDTDKKKYLDLLLLADEEESAIDKYLEKGELYVLEIDNKSVGVIVVTKESKEVLEIKNLAIDESYQGRGYGRVLIEYVEKKYKDKYDTLLVGTGDSPLTIPFYEKCGFAYSHKIENFFVYNYKNPIIENGKQLIDMIYLKKEI